MTNQACKIKFRQDALRVRDILCAYDPLGAIRAGAAADIYDREATKLLIVLHKIKNGHQTEADLRASLHALAAGRKDGVAEDGGLCADLIALAQTLDEEPPARSL